MESLTKRKLKRYTMIKFEEIKKRVTDNEDSKKTPNLKLVFLDTLTSEKKTILK